MKNRISRILTVILTIALLFNFSCLISCQSNVSYQFLMSDYSKYTLEDFEKVFGKSIELFPLRYEDYIDSEYKRFVVTKEKLSQSSAEMEYFGKFFDYCDVYVKKNKIIGFKASISYNAKNKQSEFSELEYRIGRMLNCKLVEITANKKGKSILFINDYQYKEWENEKYVIATYHTSNIQENNLNNITKWVIMVNKDEVQEIPKQILETEFDNLTLFRKERLQYQEVDNTSNPSNKHFYEKMKKEFEQIPIGDGK